MWRPWTAAAGAIIVLLAFREVFRDLFHPSQSGSLSDYVGKTMFRTFRLWPRMLSSAGPLSLVIVILCWAFLQALGFALVYLAGYPGSFEVSKGGNPSMEHSFASVVYFSLEVMTTLGFGDFIPKTNLFRFLVVIQALTGFALVTASVSWVVLLYPALGRLRTLARRTSILVAASKQTGVDIVSDESAFLLGELALSVVRARVDLVYFPVIYYFHTKRAKSALADVLPDLTWIAERGCLTDNSDRVRLSAATLNSALDDLAAILKERFVRTDAETKSEVFEAYAKDHLSHLRRAQASSAK